MQIINYKITDVLGIHARPAGLLVRLCSEFKSDIQVHKGEKIGDAKKNFQ